MFYRATMKKLFLSYFPVLITCFCQAQTYYRDSPSSESGIKHELTITPTIGYSEMSFLEGPMKNSIYYNNFHFLTRSPEFGCALNYMLNEDANIGITVNYQPIPFSSMYIRQVHFYNQASNLYKFTNSPEFECSYNYFLLEDDINIGVVVNYQTMQCASLGQQPFYPPDLQFRYYNIGIPILYDFKGINKTRLHYFAGFRVDLSVWNEKDNWSMGYNAQYEPVIITVREDFRRTNDVQFNLLFHGGMRYSVSPGIRTQLDFGFGFSTPYYAQLGVIFRLNKKPHE